MKLKDIKKRMKVKIKRIDFLGLNGKEGRVIAVVPYLLYPVEVKIEGQDISMFKAYELEKV